MKTIESQKRNTQEKIELIEEDIVETKETLEKKCERLSKRLDRYMNEAEHDHDVLMELQRYNKEVEFLNKLLGREKTWLGKIFFRLFFK